MKVITSKHQQQIRCREQEPEQHILVRIPASANMRIYWNPSWGKCSEEKVTIKSDENEYRTLSGIGYFIRTPAPRAQDIANTRT